MKTTIKAGLTLAGILFVIAFLHAQVKSDHLISTSKNKVNMDTTQRLDKKLIYFIDKFNVPSGSIDEFTERMNYNRDFVKKLPGFIESEAYGQRNEQGNWSIITIAVWDNERSLQDAKQAVQSEFKRINFNPSEFYQRLEITIERGLYTKLKE